MIAFGDAGIGIRNSLKCANPWIVERDVLAIKRAFFEGVSGRRDRSGGLGFKTVAEILHKQGGTIVIRSGFGSVLFDAKSRKTVTNDHSLSFPGTQTSFIL